MPTGRLTLRTSLTAALACLLMAVSGTRQSHAGCMDWLFGRQVTYTANYPVTVAPYAYPPAYAPIYTPAPTAYSSPAPTVQSGAYQAQRPVIYPSGMTTVQTFENPSVYTGMPVGSAPSLGTTTFADPSAYAAQRLPIPSSSAFGQPIYSQPIYSQPAYGQPIQTLDRVPISSTLRGYAGTNPIAASPQYTANYSGAVAPMSYNTPATYGAPPAQYIPAQGLPLNIPAQGLPLSEPRWRFGSGLSRFFNSLLGRNTQYVTSYNNTPITYYRPVTSIDPMTGTTVTVQQPCSSYVQQLQRVPYNTFLPISGGTIPIQAGADVCATPMVGNAYSNEYLPMTATPGSFVPPGVIGQVGGQSQFGDSGVTTIPSTIPESSYSNSQPLRGGYSVSPPGGSPSGSAFDPADQEAIDQPELKAGRPELDATTDRSSTSSSGSDPGYLDNYYNEYFNDRTDLYDNRSGRSTTDAESNDASRPAIQLDPPVTRATPVSPPDLPFDRAERFTTKTPPSIRSTDLAAEAAESTFSTLRPITAPAGPIDQTGLPLTTPAQQPAESPQPAETPRARILPPPPLPAPANRAADPSGLFRQRTETSASQPLPAQDSVSVPVREATTRYYNVRQVAAWDDPVSAPNVRPTRTNPPAAAVRDGGGWMPAP